jgi:hypothetical protein
MRRCPLEVALLLQAVSWEEAMATQTAARPFTIGQSVHVGDDGPQEYRGRTGIVTELGPGKDEYRVEFEDGLTPTTGYLPYRSLSKAQLRPPRRSAAG